MHSTSTCVWRGGKTVHQAIETVFWLCNFIVRFYQSSPTMLITAALSSALCADFSPYFPRPEMVNNRYLSGFIPTIHSPNNKSYMDVLDIFLEKLWRGRFTA